MPKLKTLRIETVTPIACKRAINHYGFSVLSEETLGGLTIVNTDIKSKEDAYKVGALHMRVALANEKGENPLPELFDESKKPKKQ